MNSALPVFHSSAFSVWTGSCRAGTRTEQLCAGALSFPLTEWPRRAHSDSKKRRHCVRAWNLVLVSNKCSPSKVGLWRGDQLDRQLPSKPSYQMYVSRLKPESFLLMLITAVACTLMAKWKYEKYRIKLIFTLNLFLFPLLFLLYPPGHQQEANEPGSARGFLVLTSHLSGAAAQECYC